MQTYVINTSENREFDELKSKFLFDLARYSNITWMYSGLAGIDDCAKQIIEEKQRVPMAEKCRVLVLVDLFSFENSAYPEYLKLYKAIIELYLLHHFFNPLRKARVSIAEREIIFIQYLSTQEEIYQDSAEKEHLAAILGMPEEAKELTEEEKKNAPPPNRYPDFKVEYDEGKRRLVFPAPQFCINDEKDLATLAPGADPAAVTFDKFYQSFSRERSDLANNGIKKTSFEASGSDSSSAAADTLILSLYLIRKYEKQSNIGRAEESTRIPDIKMDYLKAHLQDSYKNVLAALEVARHTKNGYYSLELPDDGSMRESAEGGEELTDVTEIKMISDFEDQYKEIRRLAMQDTDEMPPEDRKKLDRMMAEYKEERNKKRESITHEEDKRNILSTAKHSKSASSDLDYKNAMAVYEKKLREHLKTALEADRQAVKYDEELKAADKAYDKYKEAEASLARNLVGDLVFFLITLAVMLIPFIVLRSTDSFLETIGLGIAVGISAAVFGGIFILSLILHVLPHMRRMRNARSKMQEIFESTMKKQAESLATLRLRYKKELLLIEDIRYKMRVITFLHQTNFEQNRHAEVHREMLERVGDALRGMMNRLFGIRFHVDTNIDGISTRDIFDIKKPIHSDANSVYRVFSEEAIKKMFE